MSRFAAVTRRLLLLLKGIGTYWHIITAIAGLLDARTLAALAGLGLLAIGVAGKWDADTAFIVLGILLISAVVWPSLLALFIVRGSNK